MENFLSHQGYVALVLLALIEATCIPIPSEITFGFAGVLASTGHFNLALVIVLGTIGEVLGSLVAYTVGRVGGRPAVERIGKYVLVSTRDLDRAERWFAGRGAVAVGIGRAMPLVRAFVSLVAGISDMALGTFVVASAIGTLVYVSALSTIGYEVGQSWHRVAHDFSLAGYVVIAVVAIVIVGFIWHRLGTMRKERAAAVKST